MAADSAASRSTKTKAVKSGLNKTDWFRTVFIVLLVVVVGFVGGWAGATAKQNSTKTIGGSNTAKQQIVSSESSLISQIAKDMGPSVVSVETTGTTAHADIFGYTQRQQSAGAGTGIIISSDGVIITNRHVVPAGTSQVSVILSDGTRLTDVDVIGRTSESDSLDVAFLKIKDKKGKTLQPAPLGDSGKMQVGDKVVAIGNALGQFQNTVTAGILSGYGRSIVAGDETGTSTETLQNLFQTDAAINEGNSGGPLVNMSGEVIGMNTAIAGSAQNIGFAIPINDVKGLVKSVLEKGKLERPYLGVHYVSINDEIAYQFNLPAKRGAYIAPSQTGGSPVISGSPADKAGLKEKDIITKVDGTAVDETHSLTSLLGQHAVGDEITLTILRDGKEQTVKVKLEAAPQS